METIDDSATRTAFGPRCTLLFVIVGILSYPVALMAFRAAGQAAFASNDTGQRAVDTGLAIAFLAFAFALPVMGFALALVNKNSEPSKRSTFQRRVSHLAFCTPPLYVAAGAYFGLLKLGRHELLAWTVLWLAIGLLLSLRLPKLATTASAARNHTVLRTVHGCVAACLVLAFIAGHFINHLSALLGTDIQIKVMHFLRLWYRSPFVQPVLVACFLFMMGSGAVLARSRTAASADTLGILQTLTGAYLATFLFSHLTSTFLARSRGVDTDWLWATSAPDGLITGYARLIPHYALGVACLVTHLGCGLRVVLLQHGTPKPLADKINWVIAGCGLLLAIAIMSGMLGVRI